MIEKTRSGQFTLHTEKETGASRQQNNKKRRKSSGTKKKDLLAAKKNFRKRSVGKTRRRRERQEDPSEAKRREDPPKTRTPRGPFRSEEPRRPPGTEIAERIQLVDNFTHHDDVRIPDSARKEPGPDKKTSKSRFGLSKQNAETEQKPPSRALTARR